jgi:molecular chaperone GrpE (heat shock protein)
MQETEQKAAEKTALQETNEAISQHCFEAGRLYYEIQLDEAELERKKIRFKNMQIDFDKLRKAFLKAQMDLRATQPAAAVDGLELRQ